MFFLLEAWKPQYLFIVIEQKQWPVNFLSIFPFVFHRRNSYRFWIIVSKLLQTVHFYRTKLIKFTQWHACYHMQMHVEENLLRESHMITSNARNCRCICIISDALLCDVHAQNAKQHPPHTSNTLNNIVFFHFFSFYWYPKGMWCKP